MDPYEAQQAVAQAIRTALESVGRSQSWLGAQVAHVEGRPDPYAQALVSEWLAGKTAIPPGRLFVIEQVLGRKPGTMSRLAGYLPVEARTSVSVADAIDTDPALSLEGRAVVLAAYRAAVAAGKAR